MHQSFRLRLIIRGFLFWNLKFCPRWLGGDPGRGRRIWWVLVLCRVVGDPPRVEERIAGQELSRRRGIEGI